MSKRQPATAIADLVAALRAFDAPVLTDGKAPAFGENYVQEARSKRADLTGLELEWHLIGHLQSNKAGEAAALFDWVQTVDRPGLVQALSRNRRPDQAPLNVLIQVNIDDEDSKHGCEPAAIMPLAAQIADMPHLTLRGLMAIPTPFPDLELRRGAFRRVRELFDDMHRVHAAVDTLSMGMSEDFTVAIEEGSTMVRIGTALFGPRPIVDVQA